MCVSVCVSGRRVCFLRGFSWRGMKLDFKRQLAPEGCFFFPSPPSCKTENVKCEWESAPTCAF